MLGDSSTVGRKGNLQAPALMVGIAVISSGNNRHRVSRHGFRVRLLGAPERRAIEYSAPRKDELLDTRRPGKTHYELGGV